MVERTECYKLQGKPSAMIRRFLSLIETSTVRYDNIYFFFALANNLGCFLAFVEWKFSFVSLGETSFIIVNSP